MQVEGERKYSQFPKYTRLIFREENLVPSNPTFEARKLRGLIPGDAIVIANAARVSEISPCYAQKH